MTKETKTSKTRAKKKVVAKKAASKKATPKKEAAKTKANSKAEMTQDHPKQSSRLWKWIRGILALSIWGGVVATALLIWFAWDLPRPETATQAVTRAPTMTLLDSEGKVLLRQGGIHGQAVTLKQVPPYLVQAFIATEDRRFFDHFGIDLIGFMRAMAVNVTSGQYRQGGSGITQQLAKNLFLSPEKTIRRKVQELLLAFWLEYHFSKSEILEIYLNRVYLGAGVYGVDAASRLYFGKPAARLSLYESAVLAGLPKAPSAYNPRANAEKSAERANLVLDLMVRAEYLDEKTAQANKRKKVQTVGMTAGQNKRYFTDWVMGRITHLIGPMAEDLIIRTTYNKRHQQVLEKQMRALMPQARKSRADQVAAVIMDDHGAVTAMLGGSNWADSPFNRAVHAKRQTGSVFKTMAYIAGLESGLGLQDEIDISNVVIEGWSPRDQALINDPLPTGMVTLKEGLRRSLNKAAVAVAEIAGREKVIQVARRLGVTAPLEPLPSLPLGAQEVTLLEMTGAYAILSNQGKAVVPHGILEIMTGDGTVLFTNYDDESQLVNEVVVDEITEMLQAVVENGTGHRAAIEGLDVAGKTGTTQNNKDAWFIGFARESSWFSRKPGLTMGVWMGNDQADPMKNVSGGGYPAILWQRVMSELQ